jgi:hypothetical protein
MSGAQAIWGLTGGVLNLAVAGTFWIGLGTWALGPGFYVAMAATIAYSLMLAVGSIRLRRRFGGFGMSDVRAAPSGSPTRRMSVGFRLVTVAQVISIALIVIICTWLGRTELIWSLIGLAVSLHLAPLGLVFNVPAYYIVAAVGATLSLASVFVFTGALSAFVLGVGLGVPFLACATYLFMSADKIARGSSTVA